MIPLVALLAVQIAASAALDPDAKPAEIAQASGPHGTSGDQRYDAVGFAGIAEADDSHGVSVTSNAVTQGSFVEITALDSGHTIVASVSGRGVSGAHIAELSPAAAKMLGTGGAAQAVRIRSVTPTIQDQVALHRAGAASARIDAPAVLLVGLRKRLPPAPPAPTATAIPKVAMSAKIAKSASSDLTLKANATDKRAVSVIPIIKTPPPSSPKPVPTKAPPTAASAVRGENWYVQAATLSSHDRAQALANALGGGRVVAVKTLHRVQIGPFPTQISATRARDGIVRRGYGGASVIRAQ